VGPALCVKQGNDEVRYTHRNTWPTCVIREMEPVGIPIVGMPRQIIRSCLLGLWFPLPCEALCRRDLLRGHLFGEEIPLIAVFVLVVATGVRGCEVQPHMGLHVVLGRSLAALIHQAEVELSGRVPLLGTLAVPANGLGIILCAALAVRIHEAEVVLSVCASLFGIFAIPASGLSVIGSARFAVLL
jgi:hypothetical protein